MSGTIVADLPIALRNAWALSFGDGIEPRVPTPSTTIYDEPHRHLSRYDRSTPATGRPVLLVPPLAVTVSCYDLRPGQSLVEYLLEIGKQPYVIDYGQIGYADRDLGFEEWTHDIIPTAVRRISADHGGAPVDVIGWSFGGTISVLTAAAHPDLPISSVTAIGTPFDQRKNPGMALPRAIARFTGGREVTAPTKWFGGIPKEAVRAGFRVQAMSREITRPVFIARNIANTEALARMESIDRFIGEMPGYPGRLYRQSYRQFIQRNELAKGKVNLSPDCVIELSELTCRVLLIGSRSDILAPAAAVAAGVDVLTGAAEARYEEVGGSHLGMVAGPEARTTTWPAIESFIKG